MYHRLREDQWGLFIEGVFVCIILFQCSGSNQHHCVYCISWCSTDWIIIYDYKRPLNAELMTNTVIPRTTI